MWVVTAVDIESRTVDVMSSEGKALQHVDIPVLLPIPEPNAEVTIDEKTHSLICIINLNRRGLTHDNPDVDADEEPCPDLKLSPGDMLYRIPGQGFFGTMKNFMAAIGARSTGIFINGISRSIRAVTDDIDIYSENGSYRLKITASENPDIEPSMVLNLGSSFRMNIDASNGKVLLNLMDILTFNLTPDNIRADLVNPLTKATTNLLDQDFEKDAKEAEEKGGTGDREERFDFNTKLRVSLSEALLAFSKITATGSDIMLSGSKSLKLSGEKMTIKSGFLSAVLNELVFDLGEKGQAGSFHLNNGMHSHFRMDKDIRMFGQDIKFLGDQDNIPSYFFLERILEELLLYLQIQASTLSAIYPLASIGANWIKTEAVIRGFLLPYLKNPNLKTNLPVTPPVKATLP